MRISSGMISSQYLRNLNRESYLLNKSATTAYDFRAFEKPSDDPFLAAQTFQIRRQLALNEDYTSNIQNVKGAISSAESTLQTVSGILTSADNNTVLKNLLAGITGSSNESDRDTAADTLLKMRDAIVSDMNAQYGNRYLFSGAGGYGVAPFSVDGDGNLLYRGVNVDTGVNTNGASVTIDYKFGGNDRSMQIDFGAGLGGKLNGYSVSITAGGASNAVTVDPGAKTISITMQTGATKQQLQDFLQGAGGDTSFLTQLSTAAATDSNLAGISAEDLSQITISGIDETGIAGEAVQSSTGWSDGITNQVNLAALAGETSYVDIGLGMKTDKVTGKVVDQSAYNAAMPGIAFLGYGTDTVDGAEVPKNVYSLLGKMAGILKDDSLSGNGLLEAIKPYMDSFSASSDELSSSLAKIGTDVTFLDSTDDSITNVNLSLNTRDENVEFVDTSDAIVNFTMQRFCYQAALQIGTNILQPTLLDFMK